MGRIASIAFALAAVSCAPHGDPGTQPLMRYDAKATFYESPFPGEHRRLLSGKPDVSKFPNPGKVDIAEKIRALLEKDADGFAQSAAVYFAMSGKLSPAALPSTPTATDPNIFLIGADPKAPDFAVRYPVSAHFFDDGGPFGTTNLLAILPLQGAPLRPKTLYAAGVMKGLGDAAQKRLGRSDEMAEIAAGKAPASMSAAAFAEYTTALSALDHAGLKRSEISGLTVFRTADPVSKLKILRDAMLALPLPHVSADPHLTEVFPDYCAYATEISMPDFQTGDPPFLIDGGRIEIDAGGKPTSVHMETANVVVTIPRSPMPAGGYPGVVFIRTGGGGDRPLVDRGPQATPGGPPIVPGTGPAMIFARAGFAGASVDGPLGGARNLTHADEQFLIFNIQNPNAMRDNLQESALEIVLVSHILDGIDVDVSSCPGASAPSGRARFDAAHLALMGHSMGATIAPLVLALGSRYRAVLLSGAGGSWIENVVHKRKPLAVKGVAEILLGYADIHFEITEYDPLLNLLEWAGEAADPPIYARSIISEADERPPCHVLMMQGIVDNYITPEIAAALSLSLGLDLAGEPRDATLAPLLPFAGRNQIALPAEGNREVSGMRVTAVVVQHPEDGIEDGHEVVFQTDDPKREMRCFLDDFRQDAAPLVPAHATVDAPCR